MVSSDGMNDVPVWQIWRRQRYVVTALTFFGFFNLYTLRVNVSVAIVEMTGNKTQVLENGTVIQTPPDYPWDSSMQGLVLSAFFYGYITTQLLGGWLALKVGGNLLLSVSVAVSAVLSIVTPWVVDLSVYGFIAIRAIQGIFQGVSYPASQELWSRWAPPAERSLLANLGYAGCDAGAVVGLTASGAIIAALGWRAVFFIFGGVGLAWVVVSLLLVKRSPAEDRLIDTRECRYIQECLGGPPEKQVGPYPWTSFLTSMPVWAILVANFTENWGYYTLLTELPMFIKETLNFDIEQTGFLSSLPSVLTVIIMPLAGWLSDWLINEGYLSIIQVRKSFCCGAFLVQTVFMMLVAFIMKPTIAVTSLSLAVGCGAFAYASFFVNPLDIAPQYASILVGLSNTAGTVPGIISPILTGVIVPNKTENEWQVVFFITSAIYVGGIIFYGLFASGETQIWALKDPSKQDPKLEQDIECSTK